MSIAFALHIAFHWKAHTPEPSLFGYIACMILVVLWTGSIGLSRVYLGYHTFQDITIGWISGFFWALFMEIYLLPFFFTKLAVEGSWLTVLGLTTMWISWLVFHPFNKKSKVAFHFSEGTFDYTPPIIAVGLASTLGIFSLGEKVPCSMDPSILLFRYGSGIPVAGILYFGSRAIFPSLIEFALKKLRVDCHYIPYGKFRDYVIENTKNPNSPVNDRYQMAWVRYVTKFLQYFSLAIWSAGSLYFFAYVKEGPSILNQN